MNYLTEQEMVCPKPINSCGENPSIWILNYDIMARFRRRTCIILLLFILFICSIMMALKTLRPDRAGFGDPFGLDLLPELQQQTVLLENKQNSLNRVQGDTVTHINNFHSSAVNTMKASMPPVNKMEEDLSSPNYNFHVFYYSWFGNPQFDGKYIHWNHPLLPHWDPKIANNYPKGRHNPPEDIGANFYPELGSYSSKDPSVIEAHMKQMRSASIGVISLSWYPPGMADENGEPTDDLVPVILDFAHKYNLKVTFHIEPYKDRDDRSMYNNVKYIIDKYGGHPAFYRRKTSTGRFLPMFYVYDSYVTIPEIWANLLTVSGSQTIRNTPYDGLFIALLVEERHKRDIHRSGFDGMYTYFATNGFSYGSSHHNWASLKAFCDSNNLMFIPSVGPGYIDTSIRPWNNHNTRNRVNGKYYETAFSAALLVRPEIISITSFNEWHEGTQIEKAVPKRTGQGQLEQAAQDHVQLGFKYLQGCGLHSLSRKPVSMFSYPCSKEVFLMFKWNFLCFSLCPLPLILSLGTTEKSLAPSSLDPPIRYLYLLIRISLSLLFSRLNRPSSLSFFSYKQCSSPLIVFVALCWTCSSRSVSVLYWGAQNWTQYSRWGLTSTE
uniref:Glycoprotein endo-alpha-1,2-mannosidase n=2 Tax=Apteryx owenii TaxID=8824 RepID=A0A8B9QH24_APTOW